jgi:hypothetical protein
MALNGLICVIRHRLFRLQRFIHNLCPEIDVGIDESIINGFMTDLPREAVRSTIYNKVH